MMLRDFLNKLEKEDKLLRIKKEVSHKYEVANIIYSNDEKPILFDNVKGFDFPIFAGITSNRDIISESLNTTKEKLLFKLVDALRKPKKPELINKAPCQEIIINKPDLQKIPLLYHLKGDGGRYATATVSTIKDPDTGRNVSYHRLMEIDNNRFTARLIKNRQTRTTYDKINDELEMAVCIGNSVAVMIAASLGPPSGEDEFCIANALDNTPMVKCITKDLEVPAHSEFVFIVDCITHRKDAIYQALIPGRYEHKTLMGMPKEPTIYDKVSQVVECKNVLVTMGGGSWLHGVVQINKKEENDPKKAIDAAFNGHKSMKHVIIVDDDVDIYNPNAIEWAIATRFQGDKDLYINPDQPGSSLDPSGKHEKGKKTKTTKVGVDATIPTNIDKNMYELVRYKKVDLNDYLG